jgi:hypothetical protein
MDEINANEPHYHVVDVTALNARHERKDPLTLKYARQGDLCELCPIKRPALISVR